MFALCEKKGEQRRLSGETAAREEIFAKRFEAESKKYLEKCAARR